MTSILRGTIVSFGLPANEPGDGTETELLSRCADELGQVQPTRAQVAEFWRPGAVYPGEPNRPFSVTGQDNSIQPWRVESDGSVHSAIS